MDSRNPAIMSHTLRPALLEPQATISLGSYSLQRGKVITWRLRCPFLGECRWGSEHFGNQGACVGYAPVPGSHNNKGLVLYSCIRGALVKYWVCIESQPVLFFSDNWMLIGTPEPESVFIVIIIAIL